MLFPAQKHRLLVQGCHALLVLPSSCHTRFRPKYDFGHLRWVPILEYESSHRLDLLDSSRSMMMAVAVLVTVTVERWLQSSWERLLVCLMR